MEDPLFTKPGKWGSPTGQVVLPRWERADLIRMVPELAALGRGLGYIPGHTGRPMVLVRARGLEPAIPTPRIVLPEWIDAALHRVA